MAIGETYDEFIEKFKPKKTTDDCYTPPKVYETVKDWVLAEYPQCKDLEIIRPFYPSGDYENEDYTGRGVIDNPPFSILAKILRFYIERGILFFLFAPHLTLFSTNVDACFICTDSLVTYENGAKVKTSFITNMDIYKVRTAPTLVRAIEEAQRVESPSIPKYLYPANVISSALLGAYKLQDFKLKADEVHFIRKLDSQKEQGKSLYGAGFLVSDDGAKKLSRLKEELKEELREELKEEPTVWTLSDRELNIIRSLGHGRVQGDI